VRGPIGRRSQDLATNLPARAAFPRRALSGHARPAGACRTPALAWSPGLLPPALPSAPPEIDRAAPTPVGRPVNALSRRRDSLPPPPSPCASHLHRDCPARVAPGTGPSSWLPEGCQSICVDRVGCQLGCQRRRSFTCQRRNTPSSWTLALAGEDSNLQLPDPRMKSPALTAPYEGSTGQANSLQRT
jgi:hypothetical protein